MTGTRVQGTASLTPLPRGFANSRRAQFVFFAAYALIVLLFTSVLQNRSAHSDSRLDTIASLVEHGTFALGSGAYQTIDKVYIDGAFYSHQPPLQTIAGAAVYYPLWRLGLRLRPPRSAAYVLVTFALTGLSGIVTLLFFIRALRFTTLPASLSLPLTAMLGLGTLLLPFATTLNSHEFTAALVSIGFYYFLTSMEDGSGVLPAIVSGLAFGLAVSADHAMLALYSAFAVCVLFRPNRRSRVLAFVVPGALAIVPTFVYYFLIGHSIKPFAARPELFNFPGSLWSSNVESEFRLTGASLNDVRFALLYGTSLLLGPHGFLVYNPASFFALFGLGRAIQRRDRHWREGLAIAAASAAIIGYYSFASVNYSGWSYSIRWFIPLLPLWCFFWPNAIEVIDLRKSLMVKATCALAVFLAFAGALNPWSPPYRGYLTPFVNIYRTIHPYEADDAARH